MADYKILNKHFLENKKNTITYREVLDIAKVILENRTESGQIYASLRYLQIYREINSPDHNIFHTISDPREFPRIAFIRDEASFSEKKCNVKKQEKENKSPNIRQSSISTNAPNDLVNFLIARLENTATKPYTWPYSITVGGGDWLHDSFRRGDTIFDAHAVLSIASNRLKISIKNPGLREQCFDAIRVIMVWGKVWKPRGSGVQVEEMNDNGSLYDAVVGHAKMIQAHIDDRQAAIDDRMRHIVNFTLMNSSWTKIWACLFPDSLLIMDSRVSFSFTRLLKTFCDENDISVSELHRFSIYGYEYWQLSQGARTVPRFRSHNRDPVRWLESTFFASDILKQVVARAVANGNDIFGGNPKDLRGLETRLFMDGG